MQYPIHTCTGEVATAHAPSRHQVLVIREKMLAGVSPWGEPFTPPAAGTRKWDESNYDWVLPTLAGDYLMKGFYRKPKQGPNIALKLHKRNPEALLLVIEAYMTNVLLPDGRWISYEQTTDGATWYPDEPMLDNFVRAWWAIAHDLAFDKNHAGAPTIFGKHLTFDESVRLVRDTSIARGDWLITSFLKIQAVSSPVALNMWEYRLSVPELKMVRSGIRDLDHVLANRKPQEALA